MTDNNNDKLESLQILLGLIKNYIINEKIVTDEQITPIILSVIKNFKNDKKEINEILSNFYLKVSSLKKDKTEFKEMFKPLQDKIHKTVFVSAHGGFDYSSLTILVPENTYIITLTDVDNSISAYLSHEIYKFLVNQGAGLFRMSKSTPDKVKLDKVVADLNHFLNKHHEKEINFKLHRPNETISDYKLEFNEEEIYDTIIHQDYFNGYLLVENIKDVTHSRMFNNYSIKNSEGIIVNCNYTTLSGLLELFGKGVYIIFSCRAYASPEASYWSNGETTNNSNSNTNNNNPNSKTVKNNTLSRQLKTQRLKKLSVRKTKKKNVTEPKKLSFNELPDSLNKNSKKQSQKLQIREVIKKEMQNKKLLSYFEQINLESKNLSLDVFLKYYNFKIFFINILTIIIYLHYQIKNTDNNNFRYYNALYIYLYYSDSYDYINFINYILNVDLNFLNSLNNDDNDLVIFYQDSDDLADDLSTFMYSLNNNVYSKLHLNDIIYNGNIKLNIDYTVFDFNLLCSLFLFISLLYYVKENFNESDLDKLQNFNIRDNIFKIVKSKYTEEYSAYDKLKQKIANIKLKMSN